MSYLIDSEVIKNYIHHVDTSFTKEEISTTIEYIPGTEVTYTPPANAQSVVYECSLQFAWDPDADSSYACTRLQYSDNDGSSWNTIDNTRVLDGSNSSSNDYDWLIATYNFLIPAWSGERKLRLAGRSYNSTSECTLGRAWAATEDTASCPHVLVYSIF